MTEGLLIQRGSRFRALWISAFLAGLALAIGIWKGPVWVAVFSGLGLAVLVGAAIRHNAPFPWLLLGSHTVLLLAGYFGYRLFLRPLSPETLRVPSLTKIYKDPDGAFEIRGPQGWLYQRIATPHEAGVKIRPLEPQHYMGVSEVTVLIRKLDRPPAIPEKFLESMVASLTGGRPQPKNIQFKTEPVRLLDGGVGLLARLTARRLWVPLSQVSLYGIKSKNQLCTVAASGLERHSVLSSVLCLGLFETLKLKTPL